MAIGSITITPDEETATVLEVRARELNKTPEEVTMQALLEFLHRNTGELSNAPEPGLTESGKRALAKLEAGEVLELADIAGAFSSGRLHDDAERLEEILREEWLRDADY